MTMKRREDELKPLKTLTAMLPLAALATLGLAQQAKAITDAEFYKKARVIVHIGFGVGGGYDAYARALSRHMGRHIPGNPKITAQNRPGAGSMIPMRPAFEADPGWQMGDGVLPLADGNGGGRSGCGRGAWNLAIGDWK